MVNLHQRSSSDLYRQFAISDLHHQAILTSNLRHQSPNIHQRSSADLRQRFSFSDLHYYAIFTITRSSASRDLHHHTIVTITQSSLSRDRHHHAIFTITRSSPSCDLHHHAIFTMTRSSAIFTGDLQCHLSRSLPVISILPVALKHFFYHLKISRDLGFILFQPIIA